MRALRNLTPAERLRRWAELNDALVEMETEAFRLRYPELTERQRFLARMRVRFGVELTAEVWPSTDGERR